MVFNIWKLPFWSLPDVGFFVSPNSRTVHWVPVICWAPWTFPPTPPQHPTPFPTCFRPGSTAGLAFGRGYSVAQGGEDEIKWGHVFFLKWKETCRFGPSIFCPFLSSQCEVDKPYPSFEVRLGVIPPFSLLGFAATSLPWSLTMEISISKGWFSTSMLNFQGYRWCLVFHETLEKIRSWKFSFFVQMGWNLKSTTTTTHFHLKMDWFVSNKNSPSVSPARSRSAISQPSLMG